MRQSPNKRRCMTGAGRWLGYLVVTFWAILALFPLYWLLVYAFHAQPLSGSTEIAPRFWPSPATWGNLIRIVSDRDFPHWYLNTIFVAVTVTITNVILSTMGGYALAKMRFPGRDLIFSTVLISMMIPGQVTIVSLYRLISDLKLVNNYAGLILPSLVGAYGIFLMKQALSTLPTEMLESARMDGCSELQLFWHIVMPLAKPGMGVLTIMTFVGQWNDFMWPLIVLNDRAKYTLQPGLARLVIETSASIAGAVHSYGAGLGFAGGLLSTVPIFIVFFAFQHYFIRGITVGAIKG